MILEELGLRVPRAPLFLMPDLVLPSAPKFLETQTHTDTGFNIHSHPWCGLGTGLGLEEMAEVQDTHALASAAWACGSQGK